ncbi:MAG: non-canonical purine NTP pyrophosphatase [Clostridia bacterium]|nr:non-canonical purine NTP pyrophosphatase [Clostridia bacterium]
MDEIVFVTHNRGKIASAQRALKNVRFRIFEYDLDEPRSDDIDYISRVKVEQAYALIQTPCISLDSGFFIDALNGFPRAFVNFALDTIGVPGILKLMEGQQNRDCRFLECLSYHDGHQIRQFHGRHDGTLSERILGADIERKWSDLWYVFRPGSCDRTMAQLSDEERSRWLLETSHDSMRAFADWYAREYRE